MPKNASFSTNGGVSDSCEWACDRGFELNDKGDGCSFIPLSNCYETTVTSAAGSLCEGQNFTLKGCAANKAAHQRLAEQLASWLDGFLQLEDECDILLYNGSADLRQALRSYLSDQSKVQGALQITPAENLGPAPMDLVKEVNESGLCGMSQGVPLDYWYEAQDKAPAARRCKATCPLREVLVQAVLGTCTSYRDCPKGLNSSKLPCCFALTEMTEKSCEGFSFRFCPVSPHPRPRARGSKLPSHALPRAPCRMFLASCGQPRGEGLRLGRNTLRLGARALSLLLLVLSAACLTGWACLGDWCGRWQLAGPVQQPGPSSRRLQLAVRLRQAFRRTVGRARMPLPFALARLPPRRLAALAPRQLLALALRVLAACTGLLQAYACACACATRAREMSFTPPPPPSLGTSCLGGIRHARPGSCLPSA